MYVKCDDIVINVEKLGDISDEEIIKLIRERGSNVLKKFSSKLKIINGKYGPYILSGKKMVKIPKNVKIENLKESDVKEIVRNSKKKK